MNPLKIRELLAGVYHDVGMKQFQNKDLTTSLNGKVQKLHCNGYIQRVGRTPRGAVIWQLTRKGYDEVLKYEKRAKKILYIAGPYSDPDPLHGVERNIIAASEAALAAWRSGWVVICPHKNTSGFQHARDIPVHVWYEGDLEMLKRCDAILLLPGWQDSSGARTEADLAQKLGLQIFIDKIPPVKAS